MEFSLFKKHLRKTTMLTFIFFIIAVIIGVAIIAGTYKNRAQGLERLVLIIIDGLLMACFVWLLHLSQGFISLAYVITTKTYITKETKTTITKFTNPWWLHLITALFLIVIYFLSITGLMYAYDDNWTQSIKSNWWVALIIFIANFAIIEFAYNFNCYSFNHDQELLSKI